MSSFYRIFVSTSFISLLSAGLYSQRSECGAQDLLAIINGEKYCPISESLSAGADPNVKQADGTSALQLLLRRNIGGHVDHDLYLLLKAGASIENLSRDDQVKLFCKVSRFLVHEEKGYRADLEVKEFGKKQMKKMAALNISINQQDSQGMTPLMHAVVNADNPVHFSWLLKNGADKDLKNNQGRTASDLFFESLNKHKEMMNEPGAYDGIEDVQSYVRAEEVRLAQATRLFQRGEAPGPLVGKVFSANGKKIEITGSGINYLAKGKKIIIKNSGGNATATVTEVLHTKAKARITGPGEAAKGDAVHFAQ